MQAICTNENERDTSRRTNIVGAIIYAEKIGKCLERKHVRGLGEKTTGI